MKFERIVVAQSVEGFQQYHADLVQCHQRIVRIIFLQVLLAILKLSQSFFMIIQLEKVVGF
jgi:hypothetical protein